MPRRQQQHGEDISEALLPAGGQSRLQAENLRVLAEDLEQCLEDVKGASEKLFCACLLPNIISRVRWRRGSGASSTLEPCTSGDFSPRPRKVTALLEPILSAWTEQSPHRAFVWRPRQDPRKSGGLAGPVWRHRQGPSGQNGDVSPRPRKVAALSEPILSVTIAPVPRGLCPAAQARSEQLVVCRWLRLPALDSKGRRGGGQSG
jgi:hypothetical protein